MAATRHLLAALQVLCAAQSSQSQDLTARHAGHTIFAPAQHLHEQRTASKIEDIESSTASLDTRAVAAEVTIDTSKPYLLDPMWKKSVGTGHAALWSRADWRAHLAAVRKDCGFEMVRGHGILDNQVMFYDGAEADANGKSENQSSCESPFMGLAPRNCSIYTLIEQAAVFWFFRFRCLQCFRLHALNRDTTPCRTVIHTRSAQQGLGSRPACASSLQSFPL
jgi:hypothetical protein